MRKSLKLVHAHLGQGLSTLQKTRARQQETWRKQCNGRARLRVRHRNGFYRCRRFVFPENHLNKYSFPSSIICILSQIDLKRFWFSVCTGKACFGSVCSSFQLVGLWSCVRMHAADGICILEWFIQLCITWRFLNTSSTIGFVHGIPTADKVASSLWSRIQKVATWKGQR